MNRWFVWLALFLACPLVAETPGLVLTEDGQPRATIVLAAAPSEKARLAAQELQTYVRKISGATLPVTTDDQPLSGNLVLVGPSRLADSVEIPSGLSNARREEGFVIVCTAARLLLAGNDLGPYHGTEYAVYDLLRELGVRWFMPGEFGEYVPRKGTLIIPPMRLRETPDFVMRNWWWHMKPELVEPERRWKLRNKMNPDLMFMTPVDGSVRKILPEKLYFQEHPEYFAMRQDGSRNPHLPNLTHPRAVEIAAGIIQDYFRQNPQANSYGFAPDDGLPRDYGPETMKLNSGLIDPIGEVSTTEEWFSFVTRVEARVREQFPDVYIATNGYATRNLPPRNVPLDDHLVVMFASIWSCTLHAFDDPHCWQKVLQGQLLQRWCQLCPNVWVYGYNHQMLVSALTPLPETTKLRRDFPLLKKWGVLGFLDESRNIWAESGIASRYLRACLEWDAEADAEALLRDFYSHWYGQAGPDLRAFYDALEDAIATSPMHGHEDRVLPELYTPALLARLAGHLEQAERLADSERSRLHVRADRLIYEHLRAYVAMEAADDAGDFARAALQADRMLELRKALHAIDPYFIWPDEEGLHTGVWYWGVTARRDDYRALAARVSGPRGRLVARLPVTATFRTDPGDEGIARSWNAADLKETGWFRLQTTSPFYAQGYQDAQGHPYLGHLWYRFRVDVPASVRGQRVLLYVPVVEAEGWCWVNGRYVGHRGYREPYLRPNSMEVEVTRALRPGQTNVIVLRVDTGRTESQVAGGVTGRPFLYTPR
ncbi:MAG: hypothetical protein AMXMBFR33_32410 [Candidatus Xenobia bacterium]